MTELASTPAAPWLQCGELVAGGFEIRRLLGQGNMGQVYEAQDLRLNRRVAIKVAPAGDRADCLLREGMALAPFRHPGLVAVHHVVVEDDRTFLVMECLSGYTLAEHIRRNAQRTALQLGDVLDLLIAVTEALQVVHEANLVHRDLKPENVMLEPGGRVVLMDFGLFRTEASAENRQTLDGTPLYMAPETIGACVQRGDGHLVDIYALGTMAFELLTQRLPFDGAHNREILLKQLSEPPPAVDTLRADVPAGLAALIASCLSKDPTQRPTGADALLTTMRSMRGRLKAPSSTGPNVLLVDDDEELIDLMTLHLRDAFPGLDVRSARSGDQALRAFLERPAQAVVFDLDMPGGNGVEFAMQLRGTSLGEAATLVAFSSFLDDQTRNLLERLGVSMSLSKGRDAAESLQPLVELLHGVRPDGGARTGARLGGVV